MVARSPDVSAADADAADDGAEVEQVQAAARTGGWWQCWTSALGLRGGGW